MLFAQDSWGWVAAAAAATAGVVAALAASGIGGWLIRSWELRNRTQRQKDRTALTEAWRLLDRYAEKLDDAEKQLAHSRVAVLACQEERMELSSAVQVLYAHAKHQDEAMRRAGLPVEPIPDLPQPRTHTGMMEAEFTQRELAQESALLRESVEEVKRKSSHEIELPPEKPSHESPPGRG